MDDEHGLKIKLSLAYGTSVLVTDKWFDPVYNIQCLNDKWKTKCMIDQTKLIEQW